MTTSLRFHGSRGIYTALATLPNGQNYPVLITKRPDGGYRVACGHGDTFTETARRRLPAAKLAACKALQRALEACQASLDLPRSEYQPQLFPLAPIPSLPASTSIAPVRGSGVGQGSGGPCNTATLSHGWDFFDDSGCFLINTDLSESDLKGRFSGC